ncbi:mismatch repair endonuclease PMS2 [Brevipalpus obovatus]|uniref:mismatch repair endonuclease PMS2 n=1 Tax=Brevipalpus obovatus TaxID=246614 RepID=UPI003D9DD9FE
MQEANFGDDSSHGSDSDKLNSSSNIRLLSKDIVKKIAAGQIIPTLSNVVKELIENSIDANATTIDIRFKEHGKELIEVNDNGEGIEESNFASLALAHYTSKLQSINELGRIKSFGFRGEALSAIAQFGELIIVTRHKSSNTGHELTFDSSGILTSQKPIARPEGTTVRIKNLFSNYPVRRKEFEESCGRNFNEMMQFIYPYALGYTNLRLIVTNTVNGRKNELLNIEPKTIRDNIVQLLGCRQMRAIQAFTQCPISEAVAEEYKLDKTYQKDEKEIEITGYVSHSDKTPSKLRKVYFFINQRPVLYPPMEKLIISLYRDANNMIHPFVLLFIDMGKYEIDLTLNPDKRTISLPKEKLMLAIIKTSLLHMFATIDLHLDSFPSQRPSTQPLSERDSNQPNENEPISIEEKLRNIQTLTQSRIRRNSPCDPHIVSSPDRSSPFNSSIDKHAQSIGRFDSEMDGDDIDILDSHEAGVFNPPRRESNSRNSSDESERAAALGAVDVTDIVFLPGTRFPRKKSSEPRSSRPKEATTSLLSRFAFSKGRKSAANESQQSISEFLSSSRSRNSPTINDSESGSHVSEPISHKDQPSNGDCSNMDSNFDADISDDVLNEIIDNLDKEEETRSNVQMSRTDSGLEDNSSSDRFRTEIIRVSPRAESRPSFFPDSRGRSDSPPSSNDLVEINSSRTASSMSSSFSENKRKYESSEDETDGRIEMEMDFSFKEDEYASYCEKIHEERKPRLSRFFTSIAQEDQEEAEKELKKELKKEAFNEMRILGQFNRAFIITQLGDDVFIIDQHASDERYNFEDLLENTVFESQRLYQAVPITLPCYQESILFTHLPTFEKMGYKFNYNESAPAGKRFSIASVPASQETILGHTEIEEVLSKMEETGGSCWNYRPERVIKLIATRACHKSVRINDPLDMKRMRAILNNMPKLKNPWVCAHGRPTIRFLFNVNEMSSIVNQNDRLPADS